MTSLYLETELAKAQEPAEQALEIARELGDVGREGRALYNFGKQAYFLGDPYKARECFESSAKCLHQAGLISEMAENLSFLSVVLGALEESAAAVKTA